MLITVILYLVDKEDRSRFSMPLYKNPDGEQFYERSNVYVVNFDHIIECLNDEELAVLIKTKEFLFLEENGVHYVQLKLADKDREIVKNRLSKLLAIIFRMDHSKSHQN